MEQKKLIDWLLDAKQMGFDWADSAIEQCRKDMRDITGDVSISDALLGAFYWGHSKEGLDFWSNIHDELIEKGL